MIALFGQIARLVELADLVVGLGGLPVAREVLAEGLVDQAVGLEALVALVQDKGILEVKHAGAKGENG